MVHFWVAFCVFSLALVLINKTHAGMGKFASRWLGDNFSQEKYMGFSITGIMAHNLLGIQFGGTDMLLDLSIHSLETTTVETPFPKNHKDGLTSMRTAFSILIS